MQLLKSKLFLLIVLLTIGSIAYSIILFTHAKKQTQADTNNSAEIPKPQPPKLFTSLNGKQLPEAEATKRPVSVVIENHPDARPQAGLPKADIVYETLAEGGITRFLAIFQTADAKNIGPIRSARPYFARIANEYNSLFAHVGGSDEVLEDINNGVYGRIVDANEYFLEKYFGRVKNKVAPHNVYSSLQKLSSILEDKNKPKVAEIEPWKFGTPDSTKTASTIQANFGLPDFSAKFTYDATSNTYKRTLAGKLHKDESGEQIAPATVIGMLTEIADIPNDPKLRITIETETSGKTYVFQNGKMAEGTWKKEKNRTRFYNQANQEIPLAPGQIWIMILPNLETSLTYTP